MGDKKRSRRREKDRDRRDRDRDRHRDRDRDKDRDKDRERDRRRKRSRSQSSSSPSSSRSSARRTKKIKKTSPKKEPQSRFPAPPPLPPPTFAFNPFLGSIAPPPPAPVITTGSSKINKAKETNIFKILPQLGWSTIMFCNTIIDPHLFGLENYDSMINKMWKRLERKMKFVGGAGVQRVVKKIIPEGVEKHEKILQAIKEKSGKEQKDKTIDENKKLGFSDFDILKSYYEKKPISEVKKMIGPENTVSF